MILYFGVLDNLHITLMVNSFFNVQSCRYFATSQYFGCTIAKGQQTDTSWTKNEPSAVDIHGYWPISIYEA